MISNHAQPLPNPFQPSTRHLNDENQSAIFGTDGASQSQGQNSESHLHAPSITSAASSKVSPSSTFEPTLKEAEDSLNRFRNEMSKHSPVIILPASTMSQELRLERPFLWLCIMAISSKSSEQQVALGMEVRLTLGWKVLLEGEKSLDLLLGALTYVAWYLF